MERSEKLKIAVDVALYYFTIITLLAFLSRVLSYLLFKSTWELSSSLKVNIPWYVVSIITIMFLAVLSNMLKRNVEGIISRDIKSLLYLIVGVLLIINAVINIPTSLVKTFLDTISRLGNDVMQIRKDQMINNVYWAIVPIVIYIIQIGIGGYFISISKNRYKHIKEIYK